MKMTFLVTLLCVSTSIHLFGQRQTLTGNVFDSETKEPLIGATIRIRSSQQGAITNALGQFTLSKRNLVIH
ncbi:MAG: carboxypeptidase-like regulatory domain-containing protein [Chryseolinea sp.]